MSAVHAMLPFLLIGIGVGDMFVISNAIDQMPYTMKADERVVAGLRHAGPSITITSLTNCLAFIFGTSI